MRCPRPSTLLEVSPCTLFAICGVMLLGAVPLQLLADANDEESGVGPAPAAPSYPDYGLGAQPGSEAMDIVFVIDGSGSIVSGCTGGFEFQKKAIINTFTGPFAFIPHDGTVAIAVIQFSDYATEHVALTVLDSATTASGVAAQIAAISQMGWGRTSDWGWRKLSMCSSMKLRIL